MELPSCPNYVRRRGCEKSDIILAGEGEDHWTFHCRTCKLIHVVSKQGVRDKSKFDNAARRREEQEEIERRWQKRRKVFC